ncbi:hypothetical protein DRP05_11650 [Archaeoglobales archaeon]|nr:MAG: hypothetical protein DRP05_11650 [Archaeoglobales archaeon]
MDLEMNLWDIVWRIGITIGGGIASIVVWELFKMFGPKGVYDRITKWERRIRLRDKIYPIIVRKSFDLTSNQEQINPISLKEQLRSELRKLFSEFNLEFIDTRNDYQLVLNIERSGIKFQMKIDLEPPDEYSEEFRILVAQMADVKFKSIERVLNVIFWNLNDLTQAFSEMSIKPTSNKVKVELTSDDIKVYLELMDTLKVESIVGSNLSVRKRDNSTVVAIEDKMGPELAKRMRELVILGHL